jgi:hypothetical protein
VAEVPWRRAPREEEMASRVLGAQTERLFSSLFSRSFSAFWGFLFAFFLSLSVVSLVSAFFLRDHLIFTSLDIDYFWMYYQGQNNFLEFSFNVPAEY